MSNTESGILSRYNSLLDKNLSGYFSNTKMRKHLIKSGMINRDGRITTQNTYRMKMAKKEHRDNVRDLLASAIVDKALDMERMRRYEIRKRLEELYKIELVQKVRAERGKRVNDDLVALLTPRKKSSKQRKAKSAAVTKTERKDTKLPIIHVVERTKKLYENAESTNSNSGGSVPEHNQPIPPSDKKKLHPHPPPGSSKKKKRNIHRGLMLAKSEQMIAHRVQLQSMAEVTMKYLGSPLNLTNDIFPSNKLSEVQIIQQHCGASTICVFRELLPANTLFTFVSRRHRGSPFGLTIYINGIQNIRISSCCEYKHKPGHKVGGKNSQFGLVAVQGAAPCYRCQIRLNLIDGNKTAEKEDQVSSSDEESAVKSYDIIVSRAGRHSESKLERPVSASVMTQTIDANDNLEGDKQEEVEINEYQDEVFEEDAQFDLNQEELTSDNEILSSSQLSESESEDDKKEGEEDDSYSLSKSSDSDKAEYSSDKQDEDNADKEEENKEEENKEEENKEEENKESTDLSSDSGDTSSSESEKSVENEVSSEHEKSNEVEESNKVENPNETSDEKPTDNSDQEDKVINHITIEKDGSSDDESTLSASSTSSNSGSDNEELEDVKDKNNVKNDSDETADSIKEEDNEIEKSSETDAVISDKAIKPEVTDQDNDSDTEVADTSDGSDSEITQDDEEGKEEEKKEENAEHHSEMSDEEVEEDKLDINVEDDDQVGTHINVEDDDQVGTQNELQENELSNVDSDSDDAERATSVISRESTMLTGNEDGNFDSANITIHFNEEVDVVTYAKAEGTSTEEETPHSDESEGEFDTVNIAGGNVVLADLGDFGDDDGNISDLVNKTENVEINSDEDEGVSLDEMSDDDIELDKFGI